MRKIVPETAIPPAIIVLKINDKNFYFFTSLATNIDISKSVAAIEINANV
jgi:hypothetical protein